MSIKNWPATQRPREKLLMQGASKLTDAELLAIFLRTGVAGKSAVDLAQQLLREFGSLRALLKADLPSFSAHLGLGSAKYAQLQAVIEMSKRYLTENLQKGAVIKNSQMVKELLCSHLRNEQQEIFGCIFLDAQHCVINYENLFYGGLAQSAVYPRQIIKRILHHNAAAVIFAHNHPSGNTMPSDNDKQMTEKIIELLNCIEVQVLDHFIIGEGEPFSMAENGMI